MDGELELPWRTYCRIIEDALAAKFDDWRPGEEMCGVLTGDEHRYFRCRNVATNPLNSFIVSPEDYRRVIRDGGRTVTGIVHSHPEGEPRPSLLDRDMYVPEGAFFLVVGLAAPQPVLGVTRYKRGMFEDVKLTLV